MLAAAALPLALACDGPAEPIVERPDLTLNTMAVTVSGSVEFDEVVQAIGGFQNVSGGEGSGIHIQADVGGLPLVIHLPGRPGVGESALGRWDPSRDYVRQDTITWVGRKPSISFGEHPAAALNYYTSLESGTVEIDSITIPADRDFWTRGRIRGRVHTRAVADSLLVAPGVLFEPDTIDISVEFWVELESWPDGRATVDFVDGALTGLSATGLIGSGSIHYIGDLNEADPLLLISVAGTLADSGDRLQLWFGTKLHGPGSAALETIDPDNINLPRTWPDHFVAGRIEGRPVASLSGTIELDAYEEYVFERWGEAKGRITVLLGVQDPSGDAELEHTTAEITFHVPVGFVVQWVTN